MVKLTESDFDQVVKNSFSKIVKLLNNKEFEDARKVSREVISISKDIINNKCWGLASDGYNFVLAAAVLFRGLVDYVDVELLFDSDQFPDKHDTIEKLWDKMWDCRDRLGFAIVYCKSETIDFILKRLDLIEKEFSRRLGQGLYMSPEILIKSEICNICKKDPRACEHIAGVIYNGVKCSSVVKDFEFRTGGSIVEYPHDPRCRIWPWRYDKNTHTAKAPFFTFFQVDDFMEQEEW